MRKAETPAARSPAETGASTGQQIVSNARPPTYKVAVVVQAERMPLVSLALLPYTLAPVHTSDWVSVTDSVTDCPLWTHEL